MDMTWVISLLVFMMVLLGSMGLYLIMGSRETMSLIKRRAEGQHGTSDVNDGAMGVSLKDRLHALLTRLGEANKPTDEVEVASIRDALVSAGYRHAQAPILFMGAKLFSGLLALGIVFLIPANLLGFPTLNAQLVMYVGAASAGYFIPVVWLHYVTAKRKERLQDAFPDALDLMVVCVEAGLALDAAISRVSSEIRFAHPELADEFNLVSLELRTGLSRAEALKNLSRRIGLEEVSSLVALLIQTDKFGTSIGQSLRVHSDAMRVSRQFRAEELAAKLPVKLLFPLIFFIFPSLFVVVLGPALVSIARTLLPSLAGH